MQLLIRSQNSSGRFVRSLALTMCEGQPVHNNDDRNMHAIARDRFHCKQKSCAYCKLHHVTLCLS